MTWTNAKDIHVHDFQGDGPAQHCSDPSCGLYAPAPALHPEMFEG